VNLRQTLFGVEFQNPVLLASGTCGYGDEMDGFVDIDELGGIVTKAITVEPRAGNAAPRVAEFAAGMLNSVGLQNPGVDAWVAHDLPPLLDRGSRVIASIWGRTVDDFAKAAAGLAPAAERLVALEVNVSCPNLEDRGQMFAHHPETTAAVIRAAVAEIGDLPVFAKLSPNVTDLRPVAAAAMDAGATGLTLVNTLLGLAIDAEERRPRLGAGGGGLSGPAIKPVALRAVWEVSRALPGVPIIGTGGVATGVDAVEMLLAGASAVGVGTATFHDPRAPERIAAELERWCRRHGVGRVGDLVGGLQS
jgi:dihydroorotate dehydrogenase (NAD+) catalytic subunit